MFTRLAVGIALICCSAFVTGVVPATAASTSGYNDFSCRPSAAHPRPVVLLHGLGGTGDGDLGPMGQELAAQGYCAFTLTYGKTEPDLGIGGTIDIDTSAREIAAFIDKVLVATGSAKADIVGHSEGGFQSLYVPKVLGYASKVDTVVALAPPTHGTTFAGLVTVADAAGLRTLVDQIVPLGCPACAQILVGGSAVERLTDGPIAQPGVEYTIIASRTDLLVVPHESELEGTEETAFVPEPGVRNFYVQDVCPFDPVGHIGLAYDSGVTVMVTNALDPARAVPVPCAFGLPV